MRSRSWVLPRLIRLCLLTALVVVCAAGQVEAGLPAVTAVTGTPIDPGSADTYYGTSTTHTAGLCGLNSIMCSLPRATAINELARTLSQGGSLSYGQFAQNVYEYVYKNIDTEFRYGLSKGAYGALLDQSGTPFDQVHLMGELLKQGIGAYATYSGQSVSYQAGVVGLSAGQFQNWTGITNAQAACQYLANGGIPFAVNGQTPASCSTLSGNVSTVSLSHIWISTNGLLYDPSLKAYAVSTGFDIASAMGCGNASSPTCGSSAVTAALTGASTGFDSSAQANYVQSVNYTNLGTTLNNFATNLQHYIEQNKPTAQVQDIVGGWRIDPSQMPTPAASLPYSSVTVQHTWTGDIPDQYRSRLHAQFDNINVWLFADETYGYWLHIAGQYSGTSFTTRYATLFFEREVGTGFLATPNITIGTFYNNTTGTSSLPTNEIVPLANSTVGNVTTDNVLLSLTADHPYAASSGMYADDVFSNNVRFGYWTSSGKSSGAPGLLLVQAWGRTGRGNVARASLMAGDKDQLQSHFFSRQVQGSALPGQEFIFSNFSSATVQEQWLAQAGEAVSIGDAIAGSRTLEQDSVGYLADGNNSILIDAQSELGVVGVAGSGAASRAQFDMAVAAYDAFEGGASEQVNDSPDGANAMRWFELTNEKGTRFYEATPANVSSVLGASTNYTPFFTGTNPAQVVQNYLATTNSPTFNMIVPKNGHVGTWGTLHYEYAPLLAYATDDSAIAYLTSQGDKGGGYSVTATDPLAQAQQSVQATKPTKSFTFNVDAASGALTSTAQSDIATGSGDFPHSLSYQRYYSSTENAIPFCAPQTAGSFTVTSCYDLPDRRMMLGWTDNWQIDANISSDGFRGLGSDAGVEASAALVALYAIQNLSGASTFQNRLTIAFIGAWLQDQLEANGVVINKPPVTKTYYRLPDGRFSPRPGQQGFVSVTGARVRVIASDGWAYDYGGISLSETDGHGAVQGFSPGRTLILALGPQAIDFFKPDLWSFPDGTSISFTYSASSLPPAQANETFEVLTGVSNSLGRTLGFSTDTNASSDPDGYTQGFVVTDETGRSAAIRKKPAGAAGSASTTSITTPGLKVILPNGASTELSFTQIDPYEGNLSTRLSAVFVPSSKTSPYVTLSYDTLRRMSSIADANGHVSTYFPGSVGSLEQSARAATVDAIGNMTTSYSDWRGHPLELIDPLGRTTSYQYDGLGRLTQTTYPEGNATALTYDVRSNLVSTTRHAKPGCTPSPQCADITTSMIYEEGPAVLTCSNPIICNESSSDTDGNGKTTNYSWVSTSGLPQQVLLPADTNGNRPETDFAYQTCGSALQLPYTKTEKITTSVSVITQYAFNGANKCVLQSAAVDPSGLNLVTSLTFDAVGNLTAIDGPRTDVTDVSNYTWDVNRRLIFAIQPDPDGTHPMPATKYTYDVDGQLIETDLGTTTSTTGSGFTVIEAVTDAFDAVGNRIQETAPTSVTQYSYDNNDRPLCTADRMNRSATTGAFGTIPSDACALSTPIDYGSDRITKLGYDAAGEVLTETRALGTSLQEVYATHTYSPNGKEASVYDALGATHITNYAYDGFDRLKATTFADGTTEQLSNYDADGNIGTRTNRAGQAINFTYDNLDQMLTKTVPTVGSITGGTVTWAYDLKNRVQTLTDTLSNALTNCYDLAGRLTSATSSTSGTAATCGTPLNTATSRTVSYVVDQAGNQARITWPDGYYVSYAYDALNHVTTATESGTNAVLAHYAYDNLARRASVTYANGASVALSWSPESDLLTLGHAFPGGTASNVSYTDLYSPAHQVTNSTISNAIFQYGAPANGTDAYGTVNALNQYPNVTPSGQSLQSVGYDANGNLTTASGWTYSYDPENRLRTATGPSVSAIYAYDPLGRRSEKSGTGVATTFFLDDSNDNEIAEYDGSGALLNRYVPGPAVNDPIAMVVAASGTHTYFHEDKVRSVVAMSDASGNLVGSAYKYDVYGNCRTSIGACGAGEPFLFTGQRFDPETGLYYYRARYYSPSLGRFLQTDPVGYKDDLDWYAYVGNDPTNKTDPTGKDACDICVLFVFTVAVAGWEAHENTGGTTHQNDAATPSGPTTNEARGPQTAPVAGADGPHSVPRPTPGNGPLKGYTTYKPNPQNPTGHDEIKRVDVTGKPHGGVPTPHVVEKGKVRPARPDEIPPPRPPKP